MRVDADYAHDPTIPGELPVKAECLPFAQVPHTTRLFSDFLSRSSAIQQFYPRSPQFSEWFKTKHPIDVMIRPGASALLTFSIGKTETQAPRVRCWTIWLVFEPELPRL